jgi:hypothetical protein
MPIKSSCHGIVEVAQEMPPIADLDRIRSAGSDAVGAITGDDLSAGMRLQPSRDRVATVSPWRSGRRSIGRLRSRSTMIVP